MPMAMYHVVRLMHVSNQMKTFECHGLTVVRGEKPKPKIKTKTSEKSPLHVEMLQQVKKLLSPLDTCTLNSGRRNYEKHPYAVCRLHQTLASQRWRCNSLLFSVVGSGGGGGDGEPNFQLCVEQTNTMDKFSLMYASHKSYNSPKCTSTQHNASGCN